MTFGLLFLTRILIRNPILSYGIGEYGSVHFNLLFNLLHCHVNSLNVPGYFHEPSVIIMLVIPTSWCNVSSAILTSLFEFIGCTYINHCPSANISSHVLLNTEGVFANNVSLQKMIFKWRKFYYIKFVQYLLVSG